MWQLIKIGSIVINLKLILTLISFFWAGFLLWKRSEEENYDSGLMMDLFFKVLLGALIFSRIGFYLFNLKAFNSPWQILFLVDIPGMLWEGAIIGAIIFFIFGCKKNQWDLFKVADLSVFGINAGLIIGKLGIILNSFEFKSLKNIFSVIELILLAIFFYWLKSLEKNYRLFEWYKDKRGETKPGFLILVLLLFISLMPIFSQMIINGSLFYKQFIFWFNIIMVIITLIFFYFRSGGRSLTIKLPWVKKVT